MAKGRRHRWVVLLAVVMTVAAVGLFLGRGGGRPYAPPPDTFDGSSDALRRTVVVPTLDTPFPDGRSAVWCAAFQLAWDRLTANVAKGPVQLQNAEAAADLLNRAGPADQDLAPGDWYAEAGLVKDGVLSTIQQEMARKFPDVPAPTFDVPAGGAVAYGYLRAQVKFTPPFFENDDPFPFTDSGGRSVGVKAFGIRQRDDYAYHGLRDQVQVLYCSKDLFWAGTDEGEFVVDPCKSSAPYQILVAAIGRKATLAEAVADVRRKAMEPPVNDFATHAGPRDILLIPNMHWRISHRFRELEGQDKRFLNSPGGGQYLATAFQTIHFRLDRSGAELSSEAKVHVLPGVTCYHCNRPFLLILQKRGGQRPLFVMWVDNEELLDK